MAETTILVCDICGEPATETVTFRTAQGNRVKDFCARHYAELLNGSRKPTRGRRPGSTNSKPARAMTAGRKRATSPRRKAAARKARSKG
jgi:hypothetical protein